MLTLNDIHTIESDDDCTELEYYQAIQRAIRAGSWALQGSYGRSMMDAMRSGRCMLGENPAHDYWGSRIPARYEVQAGTTGSYELVEQTMGTEWAQAMLTA